MPRRIDQILAGFVEGDAISNEAVVLQGILRGWGVASEIFVDERHVSSAMKARCRPLAECAGSSGDILIHHYSIASPAVARFLAADARKVMIYHNITPSAFYRGFDARVAAQLDAARDGLRAALPRMDAVWADSRFNARELADLGAPNVDIFPLLFSPSHLDQPRDPRVFAKFAADLTNVLYVGRVAPNKSIEDLIEAFAWYHRTLNRQSRLIVVGSDRSAWRYFVMLRVLVAQLDLSTVYFERYASPSALSSYYDIADLFVTTSRHEGYCLPLVEAMHRGVPVIARDTGGMPEALGGGGILFDEASPQELAALIHRVATDAALRGEVTAAQERRMAEIRARRPDEELRRLLARWL